MKIQYNRNRYYDYYTGRWLTHDPLGVTPPGSLHNPFRIALQYSSRINLYGYINDKPARTNDPWGLWGDLVHNTFTSQWAKHKLMCFKDKIGEWCNAPDTDWRRTPVWGGAFASALILAGTNPLVTGAGKAHLKKVAYWHFPGAEDGKPVSPGSSYALREVKEGIVHCNLRQFSEGLHQLQDSYSHQSNGKLPPWLSLVGHSRDRHGWNTDHWNDPSLNPIPAGLWPINFWPAAAKNWALKILRKMRVLRSHDADNVAVYWSDVQTAGNVTKKYMQEFKNECCLIEEGPNKGACIHCSYK